MWHLCSASDFLITLELAKLSNTVTRVFITCEKLVYNLYHPFLHDTEKSTSIRLIQCSMGRDGGVVVSVSAFYLGGPSLIPADY